MSPGRINMHKQNKIFVKYSGCYSNTITNEIIATTFHYLTRVAEGDPELDDLCESELELLDPPKEVAATLPYAVAAGGIVVPSSLGTGNIPSPGEEE